MEKPFQELSWEKILGQKFSLHYSNFFQFLIPFLVPSFLARASALCIRTLRKKEDKIVIVPRKKELEIFNKLKKSQR